MIWPTASRISCPAPDPPRRDVTPRDSITGTQTISLKLPTGAKSEPRTGIDPRADRRWLSVLCDTSCTPDIRRAASTDRASHPFAAGMRYRSSSDGAGLGWSGCDPLAGCSGVVGHRLPQTAAGIRDRASTRHAFALPNCVRSASWSSSLPVPLVGHAKRKRGQNPRAFNHVGTQPPSRWVNAHRSTAPAPQSKPVTPASRLVAQTTPLVAYGLGLRIVAAGPARLRPYSCCGRLCEPEQKGLLRVRAEGGR